MVLSMILTISLSRFTKESPLTNAFTISRQRNTAWSDGVPGLTQWAIEPENTFTYQWHAYEYGTYWYHSHDMATLQDGLYGAIRIR